MNDSDIVFVILLGMEYDYTLAIGRARTVEMIESWTASLPSYLPLLSAWASKKIPSTRVTSSETDDILLLLRCCWMERWMVMG